MIEKRIVFFWTGRMSWMRYLTLWSFRKLNPDWSIELHFYNKPIAQKNWKSNTDSDTIYDGPDYCNHLDELDIKIVPHIPPSTDLPPAHICDIFQWNWLGNNSGYYADMDILWIKPLEELHNKIQNSDAVFCFEKMAMAIGFIGSDKGRMFRQIEQATKKKGSTYQYYGTQAVERAFESKKPVYRLLHKYRKLNVSVVPDQTVYPFLWDRIDDIFEYCSYIGNNTYGLHWFGGDPISQTWNNRLTEDNWKSYTNTFTDCLKKCCNEIRQ